MHKKDLSQEAVIGGSLSLFSPLSGDYRVKRPYKWKKKCSKYRFRELFKGAFRESFSRELLDRADKSGNHATVVQ